MDDCYDFACSGHLEAGETLEEGITREAQEELGLTISADSVQNVFFGYDPSEGYLKVVFRPTIEITQTPQIMEPGKCSDLKWFNTNDLPNNIAPFVKLAIQGILSGETYSTL